MSEYLGDWSLRDMLNQCKPMLPPQATSGYLNQPTRTLHQVADLLDAEIREWRKIAQRSRAIVDKAEAKLVELEARRDAIGDELCR